MKNAILVAATPNLDKSLDFYRRLGFGHFLRDGVNYFEDGGIIIEIANDPKTRTGLKFFKEDWTEEVKELQKITVVSKIEAGYVFNDFSGVNVNLIVGENQFSASSSIRSKLGNGVGVSLEGIDIENMFRIYEVLGFRKSMGDESGGWMAISNDQKFSISMMRLGSCPHMFYNPSLTYFNGKENVKIIKDLREIEIPITEEITVFNQENIVDNIIIRDPGGLGFFIFSD